MPTCPKCLHNFHRGAESLCPHCGFSLENLDKDVYKRQVDTLRGYYTGQNALYFDQIKNSVKLAKQQYEEFKKTLIPKEMCIRDRRMPSRITAL